MLSFTYTTGVQECTADGEKFTVLLSHPHPSKEIELELWYNIYQGSLAEITNQRFAFKYQTIRQLAAAFISGSGLQSVHVLNV